MKGDDWISFETEPMPDRTVSAIYLWQIGGETYVGKATSVVTRFDEYLNNVRKIENGLPYRKSKPDQFRLIHRVLAEAKKDGKPVSWRILEICEAGDHLLSRERHWIAKLKPTLNGPGATRRK